MKVIKRLFGKFTKFELALWMSSMAVIVIAFLLSGNKNYFYMIGSLIGAVMLIYNSKGDVIGQFFVVAFCIFYGIVSYSFRYYGEMITYLCMSGPMAVVAIVSWMKNPFKEGDNSEVEIYKVNRKDCLTVGISSVLVTVAFYFILKAFNTNNLVLSTVSVLTSFAAVAFTYKRSPLYAVSYMLNDVILIGLWSLAAMENSEYIAMIVCFAVFFVNDLYAFLNWIRIYKKQIKERVG